MFREWIPKDMTRVRESVRARCVLGARVVSTTRTVGSAWPNISLLRYFAVYVYSISVSWFATTWYDTELKTVSPYCKNRMRNRQGHTGCAVGGYRMERTQNTDKSYPVRFGLRAHIYLLTVFALYIYRYCTVVYLSCCLWPQGL